jgi:hypothetical protein
MASYKWKSLSMYAKMAAWHCDSGAMKAPASHGAARKGVTSQRSDGSSQRHREKSVGMITPPCRKDSMKDHAGYPSISKSPFTRRKVFVASTWSAVQPAIDAASNGPPAYAATASDAAHDPATHAKAVAGGSFGVLVIAPASMCGSFSNARSAILGVVCGAPPASAHTTWHTATAPWRLGNCAVEVWSMTTGCPTVIAQHEQGAADCL